MSERSECEALDAGVDAAESFDQVPEAIEHTDGSPQTAAEPLALVSARRDDAFEAALRSFGDAEDLVRYILKNCPPPHEPLWASCCEIGTGMLSPVLGPLRLELRQPRALFATKLAGFGSVGWSSYRFHQNSAGVHLHGLTVDDPPDAVRFDAATGTIHTQVSAFPDDGRWYLYCLARDDVFRTTALTREVFAVARAPGASADGLEPGELLHRGCLAEAWSAAIHHKWSDSALIGMLMLLLPSMAGLIALAVKSPRLKNPGHAFLCEDLKQVPGRCLDSHQQALIDLVKSGRCDPG